MQLVCPHCAGVIDVPDSLAGQTANCALCQRALTVPPMSASVVGPEAVGIATPSAKVSLFFAKRYWAPLGLSIAGLLIWGYVLSNPPSEVWLSYLLKGSVWIALYYWVYSEGWNAAVKAVKPNSYWERMSEKERQQFIK